MYIRIIYHRFMVMFSILIWLFLANLYAQNNSEENTDAAPTSFQQNTGAAPTSFQQNTGAAPHTSTPVLVFQDNQKYDSATLSKVITASWDAYLKEAHLSYIDDAAYQILEYYRQQGHCFAEVDYLLQGQQVIFKIQEYSQVIVENIQIRSHHENFPLAFPQDKLMSFITQPALLSAFFFNRQQIEKDVAAIHDFYVSQGYLNETAQIIYHFTPDPPHSKQVKIEIVITQGSIFYVSQLEFQGNSHIPSSTLQTTLEFKEPVIYTPGIQQRWAKNIQEHYRGQGYAQALVEAKIRDLAANEPQAPTSTPTADTKLAPVASLSTPAADAQAAQLDSKPAPATTAYPLRQDRAVSFTIKEGNIHHIGKISIQGQERTQEHIILRQLDIASEDRYDLEKIRSSSQNLYDTGIFNWVEIKESFSEDEKTDLEIILEERNARILTFNVGYATSYGPIAGVEYEHINWLGKGWRLLMSLESTFLVGELDKSQAVISVTEPYLFGSRSWGFTFKIFALYEITPTFTVFDRGVNFYFEKRFSPVLTGQFGYTFLVSEILDVNESAEAETEEGVTLFSILNQKFILNLRDNNSYPTAGSYHFIELEESLSTLVSDIDYFKIYGHTAWYFRIYQQWVLSVALRGGVIIPFGDTDEIPIQRRYFGGGVQSLRSFPEKQLPPWDSEDNPLGGEGIFLLSTELRIPIYGNFGMSLFAETGQIISTVRSLKDYKLDHLKYALGVSLWYNTPIGPIRFDVGVNPDRETNPLTGTEEDLFAWFISIGFSF